MTYNSSDLAYLKLLASTYKNEEAVAAEIVNLNAIQNLPKGTEFFMSDVHGEYEPFKHIMRNASGTIKLKIEENFPELSPAEQKNLATVIYYPEEKLQLVKKKVKNMPAYYEKTIDYMVRLLKIVTFKYTRSYVRKLIPQNYRYTIDELINADDGIKFRTSGHRKNIIKSIIEVGSADDMIKALADTIAAASIFKLHFLGDVFDRGSGADMILNEFEKLNSIDIQWGNHDILWMGAAAGNLACIANVIRICTRYDNLHTLEVGYGISLRPLTAFALKVYATDSCPNFNAKVSNFDAMHDTDIESLAKISKAIAVMQFKLEGQLVKKHPYYEMDKTILLDKIDYKDYTVKIGKKKYKLNNNFFPTIDPKDPYKLTPEEGAVMERLKKSFLESEKLQSHVKFLYSCGSLYKKVNGNLLFHGCMPLTKKGSFDYINTSDGPMKGKAWFDYAEHLVRLGYFGEESVDKQRGIDLCWYLWCGSKSPLFGKEKMTTFERLFIEDPQTWNEPKNPYYTLYNEEKIVEKILKEFGADAKNGSIINGHMPVKKGTSPIHANGRLIVIDGGFARAYQKTTGIAGYSLIQNSYGFILAAHEPFDSKEKAVKDEIDIHSVTVAKKDIKKRILNRDTDEGIEREETIKALKLLLDAYRTGVIKQVI